MTPREFKVWFDGFMAAADDGGVSSDSLQKLADRVYEMEAGPLGSQNLPPCETPEWKFRGTPTFDPSVVYNNGAVATSSTGSDK